MDNLFNFLQENKSDKYKKFTEKLVSTRHNILGVKLPVLRDFVKKLSQQDKLNYLNIDLEDKTFEEIMIYGFVLGSAKLSLEEFIKYFNKFLPCVDNWSHCDSVVSSLKIIGNNKEFFISVVEELLYSNKVFFVRVGFII
jgi:3-methyladenine DNA glycosylase AlkD